MPVHQNPQHSCPPPQACCLWGLTLKSLGTMVRSTYLEFGKPTLAPSLSKPVKWAAAGILWDEACNLSVRAPGAWDWQQAWVEICSPSLEAGSPFPSQLLSKVCSWGSCHSLLETRGSEVSLSILGWLPHSEPSVSSPHSPAVSKRRTKGPLGKIHFP